MPASDSVMIVPKATSEPRAMHAFRRIGAACCARIIGIKRVLTGL